MQRGNWQLSLHPHISPKRTPAIVEDLNDAIAEALRSPGVKNRLMANGSETVDGPPAAFEKPMRSDLPCFRKVMREAGIRRDFNLTARRSHNDPESPLDFRNHERRPSIVKPPLAIIREIQLVGHSSR